MSSEISQNITLVVSTGDCNGIGLEVFTKAMLKMDAQNQLAGVKFVLASHPETLQSYADAMNLPVKVFGESVDIGELKCRLLRCETSPEVNFGQMEMSAGKLSLEALTIAVQECLAGRADAMLTLPVSKFAMKSAGGTFPGQTEFLASHCGIENPLMILCSGAIRVGLATIHIPLHKVPSVISQEKIFERIMAMHNSLRRDFACAFPRIAVLGLNPHAGENGEIGTEEISAIHPAIEQAKSLGINAEGAFPADGFFAHGAFRNYDGILAMYHDQGLIPLKILANGGGVNFTAGLPIVRTSPDHGTAFALVGKGIADETATIEAILMAIDVAKARIVAW